MLIELMLIEWTWYIIKWWGIVYFDHLLDYHRVSERASGEGGEGPFQQRRRLFQPSNLINQLLWFTLIDLIQCRDGCRGSETHWIQYTSQVVCYKSHSLVGRSYLLARMTLRQALKLTARSNFIIQRNELSPEPIVSDGLAHRSADQ